MNNKRKGTFFEKEFVKLLGSNGYWAHRMAEAEDGSQPFDVIAVKDKIAYAYDCKTCDAKTFSISRLEENQILAFEKWLSCKNTEPMIAIKTKNGHIILVGYQELKEKGRIKLYE